MSCIEKELAEITQEKEAVQKKLDMQELSLADAEEMNLERRRLVKKLEQEMEKRDQLTESICALKAEVEVKTRNVEEDINVYNQKFRSMQLGKHFNGAKNCVLRLDTSMNNIIAITSSEIPNQGEGATNIEHGTSLETSALMDALRNLQGIFHQRLHQIKTQNLELLLAVEKNEAEKTRAQSDIQNIEQELQKIKDESQHTKEHMKEELSARAIQTEQLEEEIHSLEEYLEHSIKPELKELTQTRLNLECSLTAQRSKHDEILRQADEQIDTCLHWCIDHQEETSDSLETLKLDLEKHLVVAKAAC